jgi:hypothetical protein
MLQLFQVLPKHIFQFQTQRLKTQSLPIDSGATRWVDSGSGPPPPLVRIIVY